MDFAREQYLVRQEGSFRGVKEVAEIERNGEKQGKMREK